MSGIILTADPDFVDLAAEELRRDAGDAQIAAELAPGVLLVNMTESFWELAEAWRQAPPIFVRHICPVHVTLPLAGQEDDLAGLRQAVADEIVPLVESRRGFACCKQSPYTFSVQSRIFAGLPYKPFDLNNALADLIHSATGAPLDVRAPDQILSIVCADTQRTQQAAPLRPADAASSAPTQLAGRSKQAPLHPSPLALLGLSLAVHNLSNWAGGVHRFAREEDQISRAEFKLLEALEVFDIDLPPRGVALDLGAAPGGWTRVLRQRGQYVTAVDPAALDPRLEADRGVRHRRMTAQVYLADDPDRFDLIVNDMRMDARDSARLMVRYAPQLYPHGIVIMTLKLPETGRRRVVEHALTILRGAYRVAGARQLFHNRSEITLYLKPADG